MTPGEAAQIITAVASMGAMLISAGGLLVSFLNRQKIDVVKAQVEQVATKVAQVAVEANGMKDELVQEVRKASFAAGAKSETDKK